MTPLELIAQEARRSAKAARLRYVTDFSAGIHRVRVGKGFVYQTHRGRRVRNEALLERIRSLVIPPAWEDVWISPWANGHIQASGFDARGRKQYKYHPAWQQVRDEQKYGKLVLFAQALPAIRRRVKRDLQRRGMPREKVLAAVVQLLELTRIRIGNEEYAHNNATFGLTTIRNKHTRVRGSVIRFDFQGKHQIKHEIEVEHSELAEVVRRCQQLPGEELFEYVEHDGTPRDVKSEDVNEYLRTIAGREFSAKDFRTWAGTVAAAGELSQLPPATSQTGAKRASPRLWRTSPNTSAIPRPSAGNATSIPLSSRRFSKATWPASCAPLAESGTPRDYLRTKRLCCDCWSAITDAVAMRR